MSAPRVAVAGVVRRRQGIGEHLARFVARSGGRVPAFLCSSPASIPEGREVLRAHGIDACGFTDIGALLAAEPVDALVIASPAATHAAYLEQALSAGLHVLSEKPLVWDVPDAPGTAARLVLAFAERGLLLVENVQWPFTLPSYRALHPRTADAAPRHFAMRLSPMRGGARQMLRECMSHPLSLLQAVAPPGDAPLSGLSFSTADPAAERIEVSFRHPGGPSGVAARVTLAAVPEQPRPAGYALNGLSAERSVRLPEYALTLAHGGRSVDVPDPTEQMVAAFVRALGGEPLPPLPLSGPAVSWRARALAEIVAGFDRVSARN